MRTRKMWLLALAYVVLLSRSAEAALPAPAVMVLERALPLNGVPVEHLMELDRARHARYGVVDVPVEGAASPFADGLYYTTVKIGNPSRNHTFQIDTGSDVSWVACEGCKGCSTKSHHNIKMELYDPNSSSTSSKISCSDDRCRAAEQTGFTDCRTPDSPSNLCSYNLGYGDGTRASGYYVKDTMYFNTIMGKKHFSNSSASITLGCTNSLSGLMVTDGIFGFGQQQLSIVSQLNSLGVSPKVFSHCLKGSEEGGGVLVLGEIVEPRLAFTPLDTSQSNYNLNLESIAVNGEKLSIDSSLFAPSNTQGTIVDSGTTLTYLADGAYDAFVSAIVAAISPSVRPLITKWTEKRDKCFISSSRIDLLFPTVTLYFEGGAAMTVEPRNYLLRQGSVGNDVVWCIGWQNSKVFHNYPGITVLGDLALHDKIIVYDLGKMRVGWTDYNCSSISTSSFHVSGASSYNSCVIDIGVALLWLGGLLMHSALT